MTHSDKLIRFERHDQDLTTKQQLRTDLQNDIAAWEAAGGRIQEAPPLVVVPRRIRSEIASAEVMRATRKRRFNSYSESEIAAVKKLKAQGLTHAETAVRMTELFGITRSRNSIEHLCIDYGIVSVFVKKPKRISKSAIGKTMEAV
jgi:hypothetical protein